MRLTSVETTPNPNSMKINLDESFARSVTYSAAEIAGCPDPVARILAIEGVKTIFVCANFMTLNKDPRADWKPILDAVTLLLSAADAETIDADTTDVEATVDEAADDDLPDDDLAEAFAAAEIHERRQAAEKLGQCTVLVQTFRGVPIQVKVSDGQEEKRLALDTRFSAAAQSIQTATGADYLKDRYWVDWGVRYGSIEDVASEIVEEIEGGLDADALKRTVDEAVNGSAENAARKTLDEIKVDLKSDDWHQRLLAVQELSLMDGAAPTLIQLLKDPNQQVRRLVAAALGASGDADAVEPLCQVLLNDSAVGVRRTAGDALSDLGAFEAQSAMCQALSDSNKLVRWRAARFLSEIGTDDALPFLRSAAKDQEFEVRLEIEAAIERISRGKEGSMPVWRKILKDAGLADGLS